MRFKLVPPAPASLDALEEARRAVPLVPASEADCVARLVRRLDLPSRDVARTWLTYLRALELVEETGSGFRRCRADPTTDDLRAAFRDRVFGAEEVLSALDAAGRADIEDAFARVRDRVPAWERHKAPNRWTDVWRDRTEATLEWAVLLGLAERVDGGYARRSPDA